METDLTDLLGLDGPSPIPAIMSEGEIASLLGITAARVRTLARDGVLVRSSRGRFDVRPSLNAYVGQLRTHAARAGRPSQGGDALKQARTRLAEEQASLAAIKAAQARDELVSAETVTREWQSVLRDVRAAVLAIPSRFGAAMPHLSASDVAALDREIRAALEGLADGNA
jgi:phage terminase Nu1 subunit (DNA packaging protein)